MFDLEQWLRDLVRELRVDNSVKVVSQKYSTDVTLLHCKLVIDDGIFSFFVSFSINNDGYLLSSFVLPEPCDDYYKSNLLQLGHDCSSYLAKNVDLNPSVKDFRTAIMAVRRIWWGDMKVLQRTQKQKTRSGSNNAGNKCY